MKKVTTIILAVVLALTLFVACTDKSEKQTINVVIPDGAPALAIANLLSDSKFDGYDVTYSIVAGTDIATKIQSGQADIAIMPTNLAANLYNKGVSNIKLVAANAFGMQYLVGTEQIPSINALRGEKILCIGQGGTPDFLLQYVLGQYGITEADATIEYVAEGGDAVAALKAGTAKFALLAEPAATMSVAKAGTTILFDMQNEWRKFTGFDGYPQAATVVTDKIFTEHSAFLKAFLQAQVANLTWMTENVDAVNAGLKAHGSKSVFASKEVMQRCNIRYQSGIDAQEEIIKYFEIMMGFNAKFVGGKLPSESLYAAVALD